MTKKNLEKKAKIGKKSEIRTKKLEKSKEKGDQN